MIPTDTGDRRAGWKTRVVERLHDPLQLRIVLIAIVLVVGYAGVYMPLAGQIAKASANVTRERTMADLGVSIEHLQSQVAKFEKRLPHQADSKEWMQYVLDGVRGFPLRLCKLDCVAPRKIGPYQAVVLVIELQGSLYDLDEFLRWLESNPRLLRADEISITLPSKDSSTRAKQNKDELFMKLTVLGLAG